LRPDTFNKPNKPTSSFYSTTNQFGIVFSENRLIADRGGELRSLFRMILLV
jgi:hypothetical protein